MVTDLSVTRRGLIMKPSAIGDSSKMRDDPFRFVPSSWSRANSAPTQPLTQSP
jgi:hypothetical protein